MVDMFYHMQTYCACEVMHKCCDMEHMNDEQKNAWDILHKKKICHYKTSSFEKAKNKNYFFFHYVSFEMMFVAFFFVEVCS